MPRRVRALRRGWKKEKSYCENTKKPANSFPLYDPICDYLYRIFTWKLILSYKTKDNYVHIKLSNVKLLILLVWTRVVLTETILKFNLFQFLTNEPPPIFQQKRLFFIFISSPYLRGALILRALFLRGNCILCLR